MKKRTAIIVIVTLLIFVGVLFTFRKVPENTTVNNPIENSNRLSIATSTTDTIGQTAKALGIDTSKLKIISDCFKGNGSNVVGDSVVRSYVTDDKNVYVHTVDTYNNPDIYNLDKITRVVDGGYVWITDKPTQVKIIGSIRGGASEVWTNTFATDGKFVFECEKTKFYPKSFTILSNFYVKDDSAVWYVLWDKPYYKQQLAADPKTFSLDVNGEPKDKNPSYDLPPQN